MQDTNEFQLAFTDLGFALIDLFFNVVISLVFVPFSTDFFSQIFTAIQSIFTPAS